MCPRPVIVVDVLRQDLAKMPLADHDDVVKAFPTNRANHPLGVRVLPGRAGRNYRFSDAQCLGLTRKSFSINLVSIPNQVPGPQSDAPWHCNAPAGAGCGSGSGARTTPERSRWEP